MPLFKTVDMVDLVEELIVSSEQYIGTNAGIGEKFIEGLQTFAPPEGRYDLIWIQWVSGHLVDEDLVAFFKRCEVRKECSTSCDYVVLPDDMAQS